MRVAVVRGGDLGEHREREAHVVDVVRGLLVAGVPAARLTGALGVNDHEACGVGLRDHSAPLRLLEPVREQAVEVEDEGSAGLGAIGVQGRHVQVQLAHESSMVERAVEVAGAADRRIARERGVAIGVPIAVAVAVAVGVAVRVHVGVAVGVRVAVPLSSVGGSFRIVVPSTRGHDDAGGQQQRHPLHGARH